MNNYLMKAQRILVYAIEIVIIALFVLYLGFMTQYYVLFYDGTFEMFEYYKQLQVFNKEAFNLAIARKLPNVEPEHYQNFSPVYVGGILKAYYDYTERARRAYISASGKVDADQFVVKKSDAEEGMPSLVKLCVEDPERIGTSGEVVYDYLVELKLLELSNEEKKEIMEKAKRKATEDAKNEHKGARLNKLLNSIEKHPKSKNGKVITLCKKMGLSIYLDKLGSEGRNNLLKNVESKSNERLATLRKQEQEN